MQEYSPVHVLPCSRAFPNTVIVMHLPGFCNHAEAEIACVSLAHSRGQLCANRGILCNLFLFTRSGNNVYAKKRLTFAHEIIKIQSYVL